MVRFTRVRMLSLVASLLAVALAAPTVQAKPEAGRVEVSSAKDAQMPTQALIATHKG